MADPITASLLVCVACVAVGVLVWRGRGFRLAREQDPPVADTDAAAPE